MKIPCGVLVAFLVLCAAGPASADPVEWYVLGGPNLATLGHQGPQYGEDLLSRIRASTSGRWQVERLSQSGPALAIGVETRGDRPLGLAAELRFVRHGQHYRFTDSDTSTHHPTLDRRLRLNDVELPVLLLVTPLRGAIVEPVLLAGPVLGVNFRSSLETKTTGFDQSANLEENVRDPYVSGLVGVGLHVRGGPASGLLVQGRFAFDVINRFRDFGYDMRSRDVSLLVGFTFGGARGTHS